MAVRRRRVLTGLRAKRGGEMMPFFVAVREPDPGQSVVVVGPFSDRAAAEAQRPTRDGVPVPAHIIEASTTSAIVPTRTKTKRQGLKTSGASLF